MKKRVIGCLQTSFVLVSLCIANECVASHEVSHHSAKRLCGHLPKKALAESAFIGRFESHAPIPISFVLPLRNQKELEELIAKIHDPDNHEYYGKYLTSKEFVDRFAPTQEDYDKVVAYAKGLGLQVHNTHPNRLLLSVNGSSHVIESAFNLTLNTYQKGQGMQFFAPSDEPEVHSDIASTITGIVGLDNSNVCKSYAQMTKMGQATNFVQTAATTFPSGPSGGLSPNDIRMAYNLTNVSANGAGQKIALFTLGPYDPNDMIAYAQYFGLPAPNLVNVFVDGGSGGGFSGETTVDIQLMLALAPMSQIYVYQGPNSVGGILDTYNRIATDNIAQQVSTSWGWPEVYPGIQIIQAENAIFMQMAAQGQTIYAASGDRGAYDGYPNMTLEVDDPASQPYVVGVGGSVLAVDAKTGNYAGETAWNYGNYGSSGGGVSVIWSIPSWQINTPNIYSSTYRNVPDVALNADNYAIYYQGGWYMCGGTSCGAPLWTAFNALVNQQRQASLLPPLGFASPILYNIGKVTAQRSLAFHDITIGDNLFYTTKTGYDNATGWGTFNGANLLNILSDVIKVQFSSPVNNAQVRGTLNITADVTDSVGIGRVDFYADSTLIGTDSVAPYTATLNTASLPEGSHTLKAVAYNLIGTSAQASTTVVVHNALPTVTVTAPANNAIVRGMFPVTANATDPMGIAQVEFDVDATVIGTGLTAPYAATLNTTTLTEGPHVLKAIAYNVAGGSAQATASVTVHNALPTVSLVSPTNGAIVRGILNLSATATDALGIARVDFYAGSSLIGTSTVSPYTVAFDTNTVVNGSYTMKAIAYNTAGSTAQSTASVMIRNPLPPVSFSTPSNGAVVTGTIKIGINAIDSAGIKSVDIYVDSTLITTTQNAPYTALLDTTTLSKGQHTLKAVMHDYAGASFQAVETITVN